MTPITPNHSPALIATSTGISATDIAFSDIPLFQKSFSIKIALRILPGNKAINDVPQTNELAAGGAYRQTHMHASPVSCTDAKRIVHHPKVFFNLKVLSS